MNHHNNWQLLIHSFDGKLQEALMQQYHASQYLAMVGKHLVTQMEDDSNTNFSFQPEKRMFVGQELSGGNKLGLSLDSLDLLLLDSTNQVISMIPLVGKTTSWAFNDMKQILDEQGIDTGNLKNKLHYDLPDHPLNHDADFDATDHASIQELISQRHNANLVLHKIVEKYRETEPIRTWPHHFDTGSLIPVEHNDSGQLSMSLGIGWAIPDTMISEPYFYLSFWSEENIPLPAEMPALKNGVWMTPGWKGAVLALSELLGHHSEEQQMAAALSFFNDGIAIIRKTITS